MTKTFPVATPTSSIKANGYWNNNLIVDLKLTHHLIVNTIILLLLLLSKVEGHPNAMAYTRSV